MALTQWNNTPNLEWRNASDHEWVNEIIIVIVRTSALFTAKTKNYFFEALPRTYHFTTKTKNYFFEALPKIYHFTAKTTKRFFEID